MSPAPPPHTVSFDRAQTKKGLVAGADRLLVAGPPSEWHKQASVAANPADPQHVIAAWSGDFDPTDPASGERRTYRVSVSYSTDGGVSWTPSALPPVAGPLGASADLGHPVLAFGPDEVAYLLAIEGPYGGTPHVFRSADNGATWAAAKAPPEPLSLAWLACDPARPRRLYVATGFFRGPWWEPSPIPTAVVWRSDDAGETWTPRTVLRDGAGREVLALAPHVSVAADGAVHVVSVAVKDTASGDVFETPIWHWRSTDAGGTFTAQRAAGSLPASSPAPAASGEMLWVTGCAAAERFVVAWADARDGVSRVYYRATAEGGATWVGPAAGAPLLPGLPAAAGAHHLRPRLAATPQGAVGCAFYELAPGAGGRRLAMMLTAALTPEDGFGPPVAVSDAPWQPASEPSLLVRDPFIGDYFGLAADASSSFLVVWPEAHAGPRPPRPPVSEDITVYITSESGFVLVRRSGKIVKVVRFPQGGPGPRPGSAADVVRALRALAAPGALEAGERVHDPRAARALGRALREVAALLEGAALPAQRGPAEAPRR